MADISALRNLKIGSYAEFRVKSLETLPLRFVNAESAPGRDIFHFNIYGSTNLFSLCFENNCHHSCAFDGKLGRLKELSFEGVYFSDDAMIPLITYQAGSWLYRLVVDQNKDKTIYAAKEAIIKDKDMCRPVPFGYNVQGLMYYRNFDSIMDVVDGGNIKIIREGYRTL